MGKERRTYKRESRYAGGPITVCVTLAMRADLERIADLDNVGLAAVTRRCLEAGLPRVKEAGRKRRTRSGKAASQ